MAGNRFNRLPGVSPFFTAVKREGIELTSGVKQFKGQGQPISYTMDEGGNVTRSDINILASAVEQELLKMSHKIGEEDSISVTDQLAWFMSASG